MQDKTMILVPGELAAGKTTYGRMISESLKIPFYSKDLIKELLFDSIIEGDAEYETKRKLGAASYSIFYHVLEEQMKVDKPFVAESNFVKESVPIIKALLDKYNYNCITVRLEADLKVLHKRFLEREKSDERHPGLRSNGVFEDFANF